MQTFEVSGSAVFIPALILIAMGVFIVVSALLVSRLLQRRKPSTLKSTPYECGEKPVGSAWSSFNMRFYVVGLIFIIFDVESVLMFPIVSVYKWAVASKLGPVVFFEVLFFIFVLVAGIAYCWKKGDFDWVKSYNVEGSDE